MPKLDRNGLVRCRVCGCTEREPCNPPCSWKESDLCSSCDEAVRELFYWWERALRPNRLALLRELQRRLLEAGPVRFSRRKKAKADA